MRSSDASIARNLPRQLRISPRLQFATIVLGIAVAACRGASGPATADAASSEVRGSRPAYTLTLPDGEWYAVKPEALSAGARGQNWFYRKQGGAYLIVDSDQPSGGVPGAAELAGVFREANRGSLGDYELLDDEPVSFAQATMESQHYRGKEAGTMREALYGVASDGIRYVQISLFTSPAEFPDLRDEFAAILRSLQIPEFSAESARAPAAASGSRRSSANLSGLDASALVTLQSELQNELEAARAAGGERSLLAAIESDLANVESALSRDLGESSSEPSPADDSEERPDAP